MTSDHLIDINTQFGVLDCEEAFRLLKPQEKLYCYYLSEASWLGAVICPLQVSPESAVLFVIFQRLFRHNSVDDLRSIAIDECQFTEDEFHKFLVYVAAFYDNLANYRSFGDSKFIPEVDKCKVDTLIAKSNATKIDPNVNQLWNEISTAVYSLTTPRRFLGYPPENVTCYLSGNCTKSDAKLAQEFLDSKKLSAYNTRLFKQEEGVFTVRLASAETGSSAESQYAQRLAPLLGETHMFDYDDSLHQFTIELGDYSPLLRRVVAALDQAKEVALNDTQRNMLRCYIDSFLHGSVDAHKDGSRFWVADKGPTVEHYIGFIESYRDPFGSRGEWEGFVAVVNKDQSEKFGRLVQMAETFIARLPWPSAFEKDKFLKPDFTSLDVVAFASCGCPIGINIPNYNEIRQNEGFKNVSLGNVMRANIGTRPLVFLNAADEALMKEHRLAALDVCVALHELLGHGTGKLFMRNEDGTLNFDRSTIDPLTGAPVASWYDDNDTWESKFSALSSPYEECRAESVAIYLALERDILQVLGFDDPRQQDDIAYAVWLDMIRSGLRSLEFYSPAACKWGQAHCQARFVILRVLTEGDADLSGGDDAAFIKLKRHVGSDERDDLLVEVNRGELNGIGKERIGRFLRKLQVYKSTGDYAAGSAMFGEYSRVDEYWLGVRKVVLERKTPRPLLVQAALRRSDDGSDVLLKEYEPSAAGMIQSFQDRFGHFLPAGQAQQLEEELLALYRRDATFFDGCWPL